MSHTDPPTLPPELTIRLARKRDAGVIARMSRDQVERGLGWSWRSRRVARAIQDPETCVIVAIDSARRALAGFAIMKFSADAAHLHLLAVAPAHRRQGVGRALLGWLEASARTAGVTSLHLEVRASNVGARAFYASLGFHEAATVRGYYRGREHAVKMVRALT